MTNVSQHPKIRPVATTCKIAFLCMASLLSAAFASAETFIATGDTWIRSDTDTVQGSGTSGNITIGSLYNASGTGSAMRGVFSFDLSSLNLAANQSIVSVTLVLTSIGTDGVGNSTVGKITLNLYALNQSFTESQASWTKADSNTNWTNSGGSVGSLLSSNSEVETGDSGTRGETVTWGSSEAFISYVSSCVGSTLNLILLSDTVPNARTLANFASKDHATSSFRPQLIVEVQTNAIPEPSTYALLAGAGTLFAIVLLRRFR